MDLSIQRLRVFVTVADAGSISAAARKLFLSQPAVSAHVRALETSLSAQLLERMPTGTVLTPAGYALRDRAREMFAIMDRVDAEVQHAQGIADRNLVLAGTSTLGAYLLPKLLARFQHEHPTLRTELRVGNAEQVLQWVLDREVSFGLFAGPVTDEQLEITPLFEDPLVLVGWRGHPLSGRLVEPHLLRQERFILREIGSATRTEQDLSLEAWGVPAHLTWTMWSPEAARESVRAGLGLSLLSEHVVEEDLR
ncbi:LysR family transcriptional regulator, partial [Leucobacter sp. M11]|uniref:LysR family transcriptional regulator n=1 Tax=Leucobacter sp. M11 TaxID=2993565 RepID=UPI002D811108